MKILLTGATGYISQRLLPVLTDRGHEVICCVRDIKRFHSGGNPLISTVAVNFLQKESLANIPDDIDVAY